jgi:hypothetical protein
MYIIFPQVKMIDYNNYSGYSRVTAIKNSSQIKPLSRQEILGLLVEADI